MEPLIGQLMLFGGNFAPRGWAFCDGQLLSIAQNTALFSILGTTYGGDGRTTFALPDLRGRSAIHAGTGPGLSTRVLGQRFGSEYNNLTANQLAPHTHFVTGGSAPVSGTITATMHVNNGDNDAGEEPNSAFLGRNDAGSLYASSADGTSSLNSGAITVDSSGLAVDMSSVQLTTTGAASPINNMQPVLVMSWCIALVGIFPSRN